MTKADLSKLFDEKFKWMKEVLKTELKAELKAELTEVIEEKIETPFYNYRDKVMTRTSNKTLNFGLL